MSNHDLFARPPTLLRMPSWLGPGVHEESELPLEPGDYKITPGDRWTVVALKTDETVYSGIGPVEVVRATARWCTEESLRHASAMSATEAFQELLLAAQDLADVAQAQPTRDHYLSLRYAAGAVDAKEAPRFFNADFQSASISMRSMVWG